MVLSLSDMGFDYPDIKTILIESELDLNLATETLISKYSK